MKKDLGWPGRIIHACFQCVEWLQAKTLSERSLALAFNEAQTFASREGNPEIPQLRCKGFQSSGAINFRNTMVMIPKNLILTARELFVTAALSAGLLIGGMIVGFSVSTPAAAQQDRGPWDFQGTKRPAKKNIDEGGTGHGGANHANTDTDADSDSSDDDDDSADDDDDNADSQSGNNPNPYYSPNSSSPCDPPNKHGCKTSHPQ